MHAPLPVAFGILAALTWGAADFAGGLATRRAAPSRVVLIAHGVSFLLLVVLSSQLTASLTFLTVGIGLLSGIAGGIGLMLFYKALSLGTMGLSAAIAGVLTAVLPVVLALGTQGAPGRMQIAGFCLAAAAIVLIAYAPPAPGTRTSGRALLLSTLAGTGFGLQLVWLHMAVAGGTVTTEAYDGSSAAPVIRSLLLSRFGGVLVAGIAQGVGLVRGRDRAAAGSSGDNRPDSGRSGYGLSAADVSLASASVAANADAGVSRASGSGAGAFGASVCGTSGSGAGVSGASVSGAGHHVAGALVVSPSADSIPSGVVRFLRGRVYLWLPLLAAFAGLLDTAGNGFYMLSSLSGRLDVAAVLSSLYPGATILLAGIFLREHATRLQALGMGFALAAVALIAA